MTFSIMAASVENSEFRLNLYYLYDIYLNSLINIKAPGLAIPFFVFTSRQIAFRIIAYPSYLEVTS